jgi:hypothetical protein
MAQLGPKWHATREWSQPILRLENRAQGHFSAMPNWQEKHSKKVATLCQIVAFFHDAFCQHTA